MGPFFEYSAFQADVAATRARIPYYFPLIFPFARERHHAGIDLRHRISAAVHDDECAGRGIREQPCFTIGLRRVARIIHVIHPAMPAPFGVQVAIGVDPGDKFGHGAVVDEHLDLRT